MGGLALMATIKADGIDQYIDQLNQIGNLADEAISKALYEAAGLVADEMRKEIEQLPHLDDFVFGDKDNLIDGVTDSQRRGLLEGLGISKFDDKDGYKTVKVGIVGYNDTKTERWKNGQPNALIARAIISGTTFRQKNDFAGRVIKKMRPVVIEKIKISVEKSFEKVMNKE